MFVCHHNCDDGGDIGDGGDGDFNDDGGEKDIPVMFVITIVIRSPSMRP